jgi:hypothetical protein
MNDRHFQIPNQRVPESKWTKKYYIEHANRMIEFSGSDEYLLRTETIAKLYRKYSCELSEKDVELNKGLTHQYGYDLGIEYMVYPLCEMIVDQLVGEYISLPLRRKVYAMNKDAVNKKLDELVKYVSEEIFRELNEKLTPELGFTPETANPEVDLPDDIETFFEKNYKTLSEELGDDLIEHFLEVLKEKRKIKTLLQDFLIGEECTLYMGCKNGHPTIERARFDEHYIDVDPNEEIQTNPQIFAFFPLMTKNDILNEYGEELTEEQLKKVDEVFERMDQNMLVNQPFSYGKGNLQLTNSHPYANCEKGVSYKDWYDTRSSHRLRVLKMKWKSRKIVNVKIHKNKYTGEDVYTILKEDEKPRNRDRVKKLSVEVVRCIEMLGPEILLKYGVDTEDRLTYIDNQKKVHLPVVSIKGRNTMYSTENRSVVSKIAPLQKIASDMLFELRLSMKANDGQVMVYDIAQIPKQFVDSYGTKKALNRMLHHIKKDKIIFFNSKDNGTRNTFNQFTSLNLSNKGHTQEIINALMLIEELARKFVGLSKERSGEVGQYQTASGTERAVLGSNARTEIYFNPFDEFVQSMLGKMLLKSKKVYKKGQVFSYVFGDMKAKFLTIFGDFFLEDLGVYIGNRFKDKKDKDLIDQAAVQALGNATERELILDLINTLEADSASESKAILEKGLKAFEKLQAENAQAAQAAEQAQREHDKAIEDEKNKLVREGHQKDILIAKIYANNKTTTLQDQLNSQELQTAAKLDHELLMKEVEAAQQASAPATPKKEK